MTAHVVSYGTGDELVDAVAAVLSAAGLHTVNLDEVLGGTASADLLVSADGAPPRCLVEVKAAGGAAQEKLVGHLQRHLDTWPQLRPDMPVTGGVLVVNHQHKLHPSERPAQVYSRPEFVASLPVTVLSTVELFGWWRVGDWQAIRTAVLGADSTAVPAAGRSAPFAETQGTGSRTTYHSAGGDAGGPAPARRSRRLIRSGGSAVRGDLGLLVRLLLYLVTS
ncbi:MAG: hypothetical protein QOE61_5804 [Micromonosporaceae bacterium]|nr:hypothetical protein [Micromonosporaceae bacterium]